MEVRMTGLRGLPRADVPDASVITRVSQQIGGSAGSFHQGFWWASGFTALGVALAFLLPATIPVAPTARPGGVTTETAPAHR
jgi:hypothetical protein